MIVLTGDIHNILPSAKVQKMAGQHEILLGRKYSDIALEHGVKTTFFMAGKAFEEMPDECEYLQNERIEVGGHTWSSFYPSWPHRVSKLISGHYSGTRSLQKFHISKVSKLIQSIVGKEMSSWRGHGYIGDQTTYELLVKSGVVVVSDEVGPECSISRMEGLVSVPINVIPDHEYLTFTSQGRFNPCAIAPQFDQGLKQKIKRILPTDKSRLFSLSPFSNAPLEPNEWFNKFCEGIEENLSQSIVSTVLVHPVTMEALDGMQLFRKVISYLEKLNQPTLTVTEAARKFEKRESI